MTQTNSLRYKIRANNASFKQLAQVIIEGRNLMEYVVILEKGENNYSAYAPDLPGCGVVGETLEEVRTLIAEAIEFHIKGLQESGYEVPQPSFMLPVQDQPGVSSELIAAQI